MMATTVLFRGRKVFSELFVVAGSGSTTPAKIVKNKRRGRGELLD